MVYSEEECLEALVEAKDKIGKSPTQEDYAELNLTPCVKTICDKVGWNKGKKRAGLSTFRSPDESLPINEKYFQKIDTPEKSYWLGFLLGDGCVSNSSHHNTTRFALGLSQGDKEHVHKFAEAVESEHKITDHKNQGKGETKISIANQKFINGLEKHGVTPEKTHNGGMSKVSDKLKPHLVRGLYDADGNIQENENNAMIRIATASEKRAEDLIKIIPTESYISETKSIYIVVIGTVAGVEKFKSWIYPSGTETRPKLDRKYPTKT